MPAVNLVKLVENVFRPGFPEGPLKYKYIQYALRPSNPAAPPLLVVEGFHMGSVVVWRMHTRLSSGRVVLSMKSGRARWKVDHLVTLTRVRVSVPAFLSRHTLAF